MSDVYGEFLDLTDGRGNDTAGVRWLMGEDLPPEMGAIRNMSNPGAFNDPDRTGSANYYGGTMDSGGVHSNSGVNNKPPPSWSTAAASTATTSPRSASKKPPRSTTKPSAA